MPLFYNIAMIALDREIRPNQIYSSVEVAQILDISFQTVSRFCSRGVIKAKKIRGWKILGKNLLEFLDKPVKG